LNAEKARVSRAFPGTPHRAAAAKFHDERDILRPAAAEVASPRRVRMARRVWGLSKKKANYQPAPAPGVRCDRCTYMFPPLALGGCRLVRGLIQASATCDEFKRRPRS
jgi:hypothetical protein